MFICNFDNLIRFDNGKILPIRSKIGMRFNLEGVQLSEKKAGVVFIHFINQGWINKNSCIADQETFPCLCKRKEPWVGGSAYLCYLDYIIDDCFFIYISAHTMPSLRGLYSSLLELNKRPPYFLFLPAFGVPSYAHSFDLGWWRGRERSTDWALYPFHFCWRVLLG